jgi:hypothetical protein
MARPRTTNELAMLGELIGRQPPPLHYAVLFTAEAVDDWIARLEARGDDYAATETVQGRSWIVVGTGALPRPVVEPENGREMIPAAAGQFFRAAAASGRPVRLSERWAVIIGRAADDLRVDKGI